MYCLKSWFGLFCDANVVLTRFGCCALFQTVLVFVWLKIELVVQPVLELFCFVSCWFRLIYGGFEML